MHEDYQWLLKIIDSCENVWQLDICCVRLIEVFEAKHNVADASRLMGAMDLKRIVLAQQEVTVRLRPPDKQIIIASKEPPIPYDGGRATPTHLIR